MIGKRVISTIAVSLTVLTALPVPHAEERTPGDELDRFIDEMARKHGFDRGKLHRAFARTRSQPRILELMERAATPVTWNDYRARFVNPEKIEVGLRFWRDNAEPLALAQQRFGVPEAVVTAILGVETHYGKNTGRFNVLEALTILAFEYPRRAEQFRTELEHYLLLAREESLPLAKPRGSFAGAMGIAQFMPGSYRRYAVDFDGDGKRDLFDDPADAIGSVANYLAAHGWRREGPVATPAKLARGDDGVFDSAKLSTRYSLGELESKGITLDGAHHSSERAIPILLKNQAGLEYWLGFENFYVITRYNRSAYYAMAVHQLSRELASRHCERTAADDR